MHACTRMSFCVSFLKVQIEKMPRRQRPPRGAYSRPLAQGTQTFIPLTEEDDIRRRIEDIRRRALTWERFDLGGGLTGVMYTDRGGFGMIFDRVVTAEEQQRADAFYFSRVIQRAEQRRRG